MLARNFAATVVSCSLVILLLLFESAETSAIPPRSLFPRDVPKLRSVTQYSTSQTNTSVLLNSTVQLSFPPSPPLPSVENQTSSVIAIASEYFDSDTWTLYTNELRNNSFSIQPYSANGYIGARIPVQGHGLAFDENHTDPNGPPPTNGWPLFDRRLTGAYVAGFWDYQRNITATNFPELLKKGGESVISTLPVWTTLDVTDLRTNATYNTSTNNSQISNWQQSLSLKNGIVQTNLTWNPSSNSSYRLNYTVLTHRNRPSLGVVRLDITSNTRSQINVTDILDGAGSLRTHYVDSDLAFEPAIWTAVKPIGIRNVTAYEYSTITFSNNTALNQTSRTGSSLASKNASTISQQFTLSLKPNVTYSIIKYVGIASSDAYPSDPFIAARMASSQAVQAGWDSLLAEHNKAWNKIWDQADIRIPGDQELQISARATLFHLIANVREGNEGPGFGDNSISVGGLSSDSYAGFIFWDADTWMSPGLQALYPNFASSITNYRARLEGQAIKNAQSQNYTGAVFPWTSSRFGNCTSTGPCFDYVSSSRCTHSYGVANKV
ncbi:alpha,alpha-trehalase ATH1 [Sugiyamaella lignohabitans]|uniref:alpha,alpha-trehalase n=1 Tax=Sugiyamaella lignohabitans TaxID=796027 RepID=A0A167DZZ5_9ASCO|nr:alpha,alpha-trehalase ATH1 [Sugiyamaella lignohabitans]ANB13488.1 alpha,alpha-trehalase ATH1 [Sugiyamaella lignohabitans]